MRYFKIFLTCIFLGILWGGLGVAVGPGIMMLIFGAVVGAIGFFYSMSEMILDYHLKLSLAGFIVFVTSLVAILLVFSSTTLTMSGYIFVAIFILIPSYLVLFLVRNFATKF